MNNSTFNIRAWISAFVVAAFLGLYFCWLPLLSAEAERSGKWEAVRAAYLADHPACEACGCREDLNVHHVLPYHIYPELELDAGDAKHPGNLITLCREHHKMFGHLGDWKSFNPNVREDCARYREEMLARPYTKEAGVKFIKRFHLSQIQIAP
jgi:5-methylcytosine-specific restriction enzyme A